MAYIDMVFIGYKRLNTDDGVYLAIRWRRFLGVKSGGFSKKPQKEQTTAGLLCLSIYF